MAIFYISVLLAMLGQSACSGGQTTTLVEAADKGDLAAVRRLLASGSAVDDKDAKGQPPLVAAAYSGHSEVVELLLKSGADPNLSEDSEGFTPLMSAATNGHHGAVKLLLDAGARVDETDSGGYTALLYAVGKGHQEVARILIPVSRAIDVRSKKNGWTALMHAAVRGDVEILRSLLAAGADPKLTSDAGKTALMYARQGRHPAVEAILQ